MSAPRTEVLIAGAGPTGLVLALWLARSGVRVRLVDKAAEPGTTSRALAVHARTLELYQQLGIAADAVARGLPFRAANIWVRGRHVARVPLGDIGQGLSPFPYVVILPQDEHEPFLIEHLQEAGVVVERTTELVSFREQADGVVARLRGPDGTENECSAQWLCGCDGAHSTVRDAIAAGFPGGTYERLFYVADVELTGPVTNHELHAALDTADLLAVFPMRGENRGRLVGTVSRESESQRELTWSDISSVPFERLGIRVQKVRWFSTYRVHHRVAQSFRRGRAFLAGDAAHVHSPVGGQGMNTGIGDAVNLAWKLRDVLRGRAPVALLDTYERERIAFARALVATTDRAFTFATRDGFIARMVRLRAVPLVAPIATRFAWVKRFLFRTVSQIRVRYRASELSAGQAGDVRGGDRLPWVAPEQRGSDAGGTDNFAPLSSLDWQVHVYGAPHAELEHACAERGLPLHAFPWRPAMRTAGLARDAAYLVRPDGYVALADAAADATMLDRYVDAHGLRFTAPA